MQIPIKPVHQTQSGFALLTTLAFLVVSLIVFSSIMYMITSSARVTAQNNTFNTSQAAAEGIAEMAIAQMDRDFLYQSLNNASVYTTPNVNQSTWPLKFQFSDTNGNVGQVGVSIAPQNWSTNWTGLSSQFTNLYGAVAQCQVIVKATPTNQSYQTPATICESFQLAAIPVFQFGVFYNMDMDLGNGAAMTMNGAVRVNGMIYMCPQALMTFNKEVAASLLVTNADNPNDQQNHTFSAANVSYLLAGYPLSGVDSLTLPIGGANSNPTNVESIINLPPAGSGAPNAAAYAPSNQIYKYNQADLIISNSSSGINGALGTNIITIWYQDKDYSSINPMTRLTNNEVCTFLKTNGSASLPLYWTTNSPTRPTTNYASLPVTSGFPFVTNVTFYDFREKDTVQAVQIDIGLLNTWLKNPLLEGSNWNKTCGGSDGAHGNKGHPIDSIFVYNSVPATSSQLPAVRVVNGTQLPSPWGLTIATPMPIYVWGDYNIKIDNSGNTSSQKTDTSWTYPAAFMADAITILSSSWIDGQGNLPKAGNTTVNAACLEGIVPSITVGGTQHYSGGLENFLRLLEDWSGGPTLCYNGSIVVMFPSIYATNYWQLTGVYYNAPKRMWGFDANFTQQPKLPPLTPQAKAVIRGQWDAR